MRLVPVHHKVLVALAEVGQDAVAMLARRITDRRAGGGGVGLLVPFKALALVGSHAFRVLADRVIAHRSAVV